MRKIIRKYPLTTVSVVFIWIICLIPIPETPLSDVSFIDKWTHIALYFVLGSIVGHEYYRQHRDATAAQLAVWQFVVPSLMGGLIELVQKYCTFGVRSGDWLDFAADAAGAVLALVIGLIIVALRRK